MYMQCGAFSSTKKLLIAKKTYKKNSVDLVVIILKKRVNSRPKEIQKTHLYSRIVSLDFYNCTY